ncbi:hypothetical protein B0H13DRAFT_2265804 [Mycena leptocephala]|nr:hypothetical protein B0H13DRAFT_2265804 [Mycena leptocephala]
MSLGQSKILGRALRPDNVRGGDLRAAVLKSALSKLFTARPFSLFPLSSPHHPPLRGLASGRRRKNNDRRRQRRQQRGKRAALLRDIMRFQQAIGALERCLFPVIAAVHGHVLGLGVDIEADISLAADVGSLAYILKIVGNHSLLRVLAFSAANAQRLGLFSCVVPGDRADVWQAARYRREEPSGGWGDEDHFSAFAGS